MLKAVNREVIERLQDSLQQDSLQINQYLELPMEEQGEEVGRAQRQKVIPLPSETRVIDAFDRADVAGRLLILGEPGSGKTTTLLQLAEDLINRAQKSDKVPVPVIFELSAWKNDKQSIEKWLVAQLSDNYSIAENISQQWLKNHQLLPLLDGLDELGIPRQRLCVKAINQFLQQDIRRRLVVCCRYQEYQEGEVKLHKLNGAYRLQPPDESEIRDYLQRLGKPEIWDVIQTNAQMRELAEKPLFLNIMVVAYQGEAISNEERLFAAYIDEQLRLPLDREKYPQGVPYEDKETRKWLTYLARQLEAESATEFLIEKMQFDWLHTVYEKLVYMLIKGLISGLIIGLIGGLTLGLTVGLNSGLIIGLLYGLTGDVFLTRFFNYRAFKFSWNGLIIGLIHGLGVVLVYWPSFGLNFGLATGLTIGLSRGLQTEIQAQEIPNQGIRESVKRTLIILLVISPLGAFIVLLLYLAPKANFDEIQFVGLSLGIILIQGFVVGGKEWAPHLALRLVLYKRGVIPWNYARFLKYAHDRRLIQQVGGRYRFLHDALRKHFVGDERIAVQPSQSSINFWRIWIVVVFVSIILLITIPRVGVKLESLVAPTVQNSNCIARDTMTHHCKEFQRGSIVLLHYSKLENQDLNGNFYYIMQIFGLPGETFEIRQGQVYINGKLFQADYLATLPIDKYDKVKIKIPADSYFVLGKNLTDDDILLGSLVGEREIVDINTEYLYVLVLRKPWEVGEKKLGMITK
ncbi:MAG: signal peptidase I [Symploca sp. SIO2G7]|nr:signal peptidase I [Symploca sp. SIO2G7]